MLGPVFGREAVITPRRSKHYIYRVVYGTTLLILMCTAWLLLAGTQVIRNVGDMARFGAVLFQMLAPLQLALLTFLAALLSASNVAQEKDRRTLVLLMMTRISNFELVLGKLSASLLNVLALLFTALPIFLLITLFGGVSYEQVVRVYSVTLATVVAAASLGTLVGFAREKTFQILAVTALSLVLWIAVWEGVGAGALGARIGGVAASEIAATFSPLRAIFEAARPHQEAFGWLTMGSGMRFVLVTLGLAALLNVWTIARVRVWNPSREVRQGGDEEAAQPRESLSGAALDDVEGEAERARQRHVDARQRTVSEKTRSVWDNPVLWREVCTWAYGRKVIAIRLAYLLFFALAAAGIYWAVAEQAAAITQQAIVPPATRALAPFMLVSLVIINALAVTSITSERDGQAIDLLLVTDLTPREFVLGKLGGVVWITKEMILLPVLLCLYVGWQGAMTAENLLYLLGGWAVMVVFVAMLGVHCGMTYASSRTAISVSLGTVFFLFLGIVTCMVIMISFAGSFTGQLAPFLAFILGGGLGLYVTLGARNPSPAILLASLLLPFLTFFAITSFVLRDRELTVFLVTLVAYGFSTMAMLIPAIYEFDIAMGRTKTAEDE